MTNWKEILASSQEVASTRTFPNSGDPKRSSCTLCDLAQQTAPCKWFEKLQNSRLLKNLRIYRLCMNGSPEQERTLKDNQDRFRALRHYSDDDNRRLIQAKQQYKALGRSACGVAEFLWVESRVPSCWDLPDKLKQKHMRQRSKTCYSKGTAVLLVC